METEYKDFVVISLEVASDQIHLTSTNGYFTEFEKITNNTSAPNYKVLYSCFGLTPSQTVLINDAIISLDGESYSSKRDAVDGLIKKLNSDEIK